MADNKESATDDLLKTSKNPRQKRNKSHHRHPSPPKIYKDFVIPYVDYFSIHPASTGSAATPNLENGNNVRAAKRKMTSELNQKSAKRTRLQKDSKGVGHGKSNNEILTENEREMKVFKQIEQQILQKLRNELRELFGNTEEERSSSKEHQISKSEIPPQPPFSVIKSEPQCNPALNDEVYCFEQLNEILLTRHKLVLLSRTEFFKETVLGCFVRIEVGKVNGHSVFRAAQITEVVETAEVYKVEFMQTKKALLLKHGPDERIWQLNFASDVEITNTEFFKWKDAMRRANLPLPTVGDIEKKKNKIKSAFLIMNAPKRNRH